MSEEYNNFKNLDLTNQLWKIYQLLSDSSKLVVKQEIENKQYYSQDFTKVSILGQSDKALYIMKDGYSMWLAKQFIYNPEENYIPGKNYDIILLEVSAAGKKLDWVKTKWMPYKPTKVNK